MKLKTSSISDSDHYSSFLICYDVFIVCAIFLNAVLGTVSFLVSICA